MRHVLPKLRFAKSALQPFMSEETLEYHYGEHHRVYVDKLNELIVGTGFENQTLEKIVRDASGPIFNNAAQVWNHNFFWKCLSPDRSRISERLLSLEERDFGSLDQWQDTFTKKGLEVFGSGWLWLVEDGGQLKFEATHDADNPLKHGKRALLACDLWEHAYYIDYRNERQKYLSAFVKIIGWSFVEGNIKEAMGQVA